LIYLTLTYSEYWKYSKVRIW